MSTSTYTATYTATDVRRVLDSFAAEMAMAAQSTGLWTRERVAATVADVKAFALGGYLIAVHLVLRDAESREIRAAAYRATTQATGWTNQSPGNILWPVTPGGSLDVWLVLANTWWNLDDYGRAAERLRLGVAGQWAAGSFDSGHSGLSASFDRRFASNGYGLEKTCYGQGA